MQPIMVVSSANLLMVLEWSLAALSYVNSGDGCDFLKTTQWLDSVKVAMNLTKSGFHRDLIYTVQFGAPFPEDLEALLVQNVSSGVYMDVYQLQTLRKDAGLHVLLDSEVDLEAPAYESPGFTAFIYPRPDPTTPGHLTATVPIHGRYHRPSGPGTHVQVEIKYTKLLLKSDSCEHGKLPFSNLPYKIVYGPCSVHNVSICSWIEIEHLQVPQSLAMDLPVGDKSLLFLVCGGTLCVTILCNLILAATIWKHGIFEFPPYL
ncbi:phosphatidylinositol-glycan biosynthesis class X protein [Alosa pseudoharengus]|uniref:phosphatidylinositol-glycan biosynthesis class X protein n=1 Tax=Alosa pseudoharengus TaxID=34774 RepID=UPI003F8BDA0A